MNVLFRFRCSNCGKEILTDSVLLKCCNQLMENIEHITMTNQELRQLMDVYQGRLQITYGRG
jgi:hypothetical protein